MEEWKEVRLGDVCSISSSKRIFANEYQKYGIPFYRGKEIIEKQKGEKVSNELFISKDKYDVIKSKFGVPSKGDMLLTSVGTLGIPYIVQEETFYFKDGNLTWFRNYNGIFNKFLYYWFLTPMAKSQIDSKAIGSTQKALTIDVLKRFEILLPSLEEQKRISSILKSLDDKIENNRKINENLEQQAQALFKSWFVDFEPFRDQPFVESELGMIPEGWRVGTLNEFGTIICGKTPSKANPNYYDGEYPFIKIPDMHGNIFPLKHEEYISEIGAQSQANKLIPPFSLLVSCIATVGLVSINTVPSFTNQQINSIIVNNESSLYYLYLLLSEKTDELQNLGRGGTATLNVNTKIFSNIKVIIPSDNILILFNEITSPVFSKILNNAKESLRLSQLRDTLLPRLMSGELSIK